LLLKAGVAQSGRASLGQRRRSGVQSPSPAQTEAHTLKFQDMGCFFLNKDVVCLDNIYKKQKNAPNKGDFYFE
jgi:hypothetical protein